MARFICAVLFLVLTAVVASAQFDQNPILKTLHKSAAEGYAPGKSAEVSVLGFKRSSARVALDAIVNDLSDSAEERKIYREAFEESLSAYESDAKEGGYENDGTVALSVATTFLYTFASGKEVSEAGVAGMTGQFCALLDQPEIRKASDKQKQEFYEVCLGYLSLALLTANAAESDAAKAKIPEVAGSLLYSLLGAQHDRISINDKGITIKASATKVATAAPASGALAAGFTYQAPADFVIDGVWIVKHYREKDREWQVRSAMFRFLPPVPAKGNMANALREAWKTATPAEFADKASAMVYRRYTGDGIQTQFIFGRAKENGRRTDTIFTIYMVDCGTHWQPVVFGQSFEDQGDYKTGDHITADLSFGTTADFGEPFLASFKSSLAKKTDIIDVASLAGNYSYGSSAQTHWVNIYSGATSMQYVSYGGTLHLKADKTFTYTFVSASNTGSGTQLGQIKAAGTWSIKGDILTCVFTMYDQGDSYKRVKSEYRIAGATTFADGEKMAVLIEQLDRPVNAVSVTFDNSANYTTKKK